MHLVEMVVIGNNQKEKGFVGVGFVSALICSRFFKQDGTYKNDNSKKEFGDVLRARPDVSEESKAPSHMRQIQWFMRNKKRRS